MARLEQPPAKFTHPEWVISNQRKYANAEGERASAERLVMEADRIISDTDKITFKVQRDVNKKFGAVLYFDFFTFVICNLLLVYIFNFHLSRMAVHHLLRPLHALSPLASSLTRSVFHSILMPTS